ncbi:MAG: SLBB domain-containing protein [Gammaproteobacteria bacterium]|nr:SLBB domain-containing protein [Gammaproteobacteria bacterium]
MRLLAASLLALALLLGGCTSTLPMAATFSAPANAPAVFEPVDKSENINYLDPEALALFEAPSDPVYRLGAGDQLTIEVWGRPEVSGSHVVGPDGRITMPLVGPVRLADITREEAARNVHDMLDSYYTRPSVVLRVDQYTANRVTVLGRVQNPGTIQFEEQPTLLEALARAGSLPVIDKEATLTRAAVFRGREQVAWVDLRQLLNRMNPAYNIRLRPGDLIYIPDSSDTMVYVMGEVHRPGAYRLTPDMALLDALAQAGGPTEDADAGSIHIYRPEQRAMQRTPLRALVTGTQRLNFSLQEGDVIYVEKRGIARTGYVLRQLLPGLSFMTFGLATATSN